jgi:hypothetical protein
LANRYGKNISLRGFEEYLENLVKLLFKDIFGRGAPKSTWESYEDFYGWFYGAEDTGEQQGRQEKRGPVQNPVNAFVQFAVGLGIDPNEARNSPRSVYRKLSLMLHPDLNPNDKAKEEKFKILSSLFEELPNELKAKNWYQRIILATKI